MTNVTKSAIAACAGTVALACGVIQPVRAADMPPQYYGEPAQPQYYSGQVEEGPIYRPVPPAYVPIAPRPYYEPGPVVVAPEPYYVPPRRVYVHPGYGPYAHGPYVARGNGYHRGWHGGHHHHHHHHRRHW